MMNQSRKLRSTATIESAASHGGAADASHGIAKTVNRQATLTHARIQRFLRSNRGEAYVDMGVKILIGVVIGALLLGGLYTLFNTSVLPKLTDRINDMFDYRP